jgi:O-antigen/teichoic acid export membrane protein
MLNQTESDKNPPSGLGTIARGGVLILLGSLISILANFAYQFLLARLLGPSEVGLVNLGISVVTLVGLVIIFGLDRTVVRYVAYYMGLEDQKRELGVVGSVLIILGVSTLIVLPIFWAASPVLANQVFGKPDLLSVLRILSLGLPFLALTRVLLGVAQAYKQMTPILIIEQVTVPTLRVLVLVGLALLVGASSPAAALSYTLAGAAGCLPAIFFARRIYRQRRGKTSPARGVGILLHFSFLAMLSIILNRTNTQTETLVLGAFSTSEQVGIYTVGLKATIFISIFIDALATVFTPFIAELYARKDFLRLAQQLKTVNRWALTLALPMAIILFIGSPDLMALLGPGFEAGVPVLRLLVIAQVAYVVLGPGGLMLMMTDYNRLNLINAVLNLALSLVLDLVLIPRYDAIGAAVAGAITIIFVNLLRLYQTHRFLHMHPYSLSYLKPIAAGLGAAAAALAAGAWLSTAFYLIRLAGLSMVVLGVYIGLLLLLRLEDEDRSLIQTFVRRFRS